MNWEIISVRAGEEGKYLKDGWEPFAVVPEISTNFSRDSITHLRYQEVSSCMIIYLRKLTYNN